MPESLSARIRNPYRRRVPVHQTVGLEQPDEELDLDYVQGHGVEMELEYALSNSLGFGGHNASILIKKYAE